MSTRDVRQDVACPDPPATFYRHGVRNGQAGRPRRRSPLSPLANTHWSLIIEGGRDPERARASLAEICAIYRRPVLAYMRSHGYPPADAEDLTQEFFARFVEHRWDARADPARGSFRAYLFTALHRFLSNERTSRHAHKRGGAMQRITLDHAALAAPVAESPESTFNRSWMMTVIEHAARRLEREARAAGRQAIYRRLADYLIEAPDGDDYRRAAADLGMPPNTVAVNVHRLRRRLRELVRDELAQTVTDAEALELELHELRRVAGSAVID